MKKSSSETKLSSDLKKKTRVGGSQPLQPVNVQSKNTGQASPESLVENYTLSQQKERLQIKIRALEDACNSKDKQLETVKAELTKISKEKTKLQNDFQQVKTENTKLTKDMVKLSTEDAAQQSKQQVKEAIEKRKVAELEEQLTKLKHSYDQLKAEKESLYNRMTKEIDKLQSEINHIDANYVSKLDALESRRHRDIQHARHDAVRHLDQVEKELFKLKDDHKQLKTEYENVNQELVTVEKSKKHTEVQTKKDAQELRHLKSECAHFKELVEEKDNENEKLKLKFSKEINDISESVDQEIRSKDERIKELENEIKKVEETVEQLRNAYEIKINNLSSSKDTEVRTIQLKLTEALRRVSKITKELDHSAAKNEELSSELAVFKQKFADAKANLAKVQAECEGKMKNKLAEYESKIRDLERKQMEQCRLYEHKLSEAENQQSLNSDLHSLNSSEANSLRSQIQSANEALARLREENCVLVSDNFNLVETLSAKDADLKRQLKLTEEQSLANARMMEDSAKYPVSLMELEQRVTQMVAGTKKLHDRIATLQSEIASHDQSKRCLEDDLRRERYDNRLKDGYLSSLDFTANQINSEIQALAHKVRNLTVAVDSICHTRDLHNQKIHQLHQDNEFLSQALQAVRGYNPIGARLYPSVSTPALYASSLPPRRPYLYSR